MTLRTFDIPDGTLQAMTELAEITGANGASAIAEFIVDAVRVYDWILDQQAQGKTIAALMPQDAETRDPHRECLASFIAPGRREQAREYFAIT